MGAGETPRGAGGNLWGIAIGGAGSSGLVLEASETEPSSTCTCGISWCGGGSQCLSNTRRPKPVS